MRVYLPLRTEDLAAVENSGRLPSRPRYAVTPAMRAAEPRADEEDLEFDAMCAALDAAAALPGQGRRVVAAADVPEATEGVAADGAGADAVAGSAADAPGVDLEDVVSFHVEEEPGEEGTGYDALLWYDVTELTDLATA